MDAPPLRQLNVDMQGLAEAFEASGWDVLSYLDVDSGEVVSIAEEVWQEFERICATIPPQPNDEASFVAFTAALDQQDLRDWMREALIDAYAVDQERGTRYLEVPPGASVDGYADMVQFVETVSNARLQLRLQVAIRGAG